jgi:hypothetical protein
MRKPINMSDYSSPENLLRLFEVKFTRTLESASPQYDESSDDVFSGFISNVELKEREHGNLSDYSGAIHVKCLTSPDINDYYILSICSFITAKRYYERQEFITSAGHLCNAYHYLGIAEGMSNNMAMYDIAQEFIKTRKEIGAKGGKAKAQIYTKLIPAVSKLLVTEEPTNGWKSKREAADTLSANLAKRKKFPDIINENEVDRIERARNWIYKSLTTKGSPLHLEFENGRKINK